MAHPLDADGYRVRRWLRQEPWGPSYLGEDPDGDMVSVNALELKRLGISFDHEDSPDYQRLVQAIKSVSHPCLVNVRDVLYRDDTLFFIEDFTYGRRDLGDVIRRQRFIAPEAAWKLTCQLCHGAHFLHERGIYHLWIRPESILIDKGGLDARIADVGIMALLMLLKPDLDRRPWVDNSICPDWLSGGEPGRHCDTYSIAVVIREALQNGPEWNAKEAAARAEIRRFAFLEVGREIAELETELSRKPPVDNDPVQWVQLRRVINEAAHPDSKQRFSTAGIMGKAVAGARHADTYGAKQPESKPIVGMPEKRKKANLASGGIVFCQICGRPATQGERKCKSCNSPLVEPKAAPPVEAGPELGIELEKVEDWFREAGDDMVALGKTTEAEKAYRIAVYRNKEDAGCWTDLGDMYCINMKFDLAVQAYWNAVRLRPDDPALRIDLGLAYLANHRPENAKREFTWVLNSNASKELRVAALTHMGSALATQKRHQDATEMWRSVLEERPFDIGVRCSSAASYAALHNYPRAYDHVKTAMRANPDSPSAQLALRQLDKMQMRIGTGWGWPVIFFVRLPLLLLCLLAGWAGLLLYLSATAIYETIAFFWRTDFGEVLDRLRNRRREPERTDRT